MRIVVNDIAASVGGALTILHSFYDFVKKYDDKNEYIFLLSDNYIKETSRIKVILRPDIKNSKIRKLFFDFIVGRYYMKKLKPDYLLSLQNIITFGLKCRQGAYIHQPIPFQNAKRFSFFKRKEFIYAVYQYIIGYIIKKSAKRSDDVFVQTKWMKKAVFQKCKIPSEKIHIVPYVLQGMESHARNHIEMNKFFYPATVENVYKNQKCIYHACDLLKRRNISDYNVTLTVKKEKRENFTFCGSINRHNIDKYYQNMILIFPSFIETLGLPLIEAKNNKTVIFAADCEYAHEALDGYANAYFFNPSEPDELADLMQKAIEGKITLKPVPIESEKDNDLSWDLILKAINAKAVK